MWGNHLIAARLRKHGIDISGQCCRVFSPADFDRYDRIYVMDRNNLSDVMRLAHKGEDRRKVALLLGDEIVPDPYYDNALFEPVYQMIESRCKQLIDELAN
jgi:protein-tyrosine phosphatase